MGEGAEAVSVAACGALTGSFEGSFVGSAASFGCRILCNYAF